MQRGQNLTSHGRNTFSPWALLHRVKPSGATTPRRGVSAHVMQIICFLGGPFARDGRGIAWCAIGRGGERPSKAPSPSLRHVSRAFLRAACGSASRAGIRLSQSCPSERDQRSGLYLRARRRDSRRVLRPPDKRLHKRVPRRSMIGSPEAPRACACAREGDRRTKLAVRDAAAGRPLR
jgi:hypothetical protein